MARDLSLLPSPPRLLDDASCVIESLVTACLVKASLAPTPKERPDLAAPTSSPPQLPTWSGLSPPKRPPQEATNPEEGQPSRERQSRKEVERLRSGAIEKEEGKGMAGGEGDCRN